MRRTWLVMAAIGLSACQDEATFVNDGVVAFALTEDTPPLVETRDAALYLVESRIALPISEPGDVVLRMRAEEAGDYENLPFPRLPWVERDDLAIEIDYTIANMDDAPHTAVTVTVNGFNEFHEYMPGFTIDQNDVIVDFAQWERTHSLQPLEHESFTVREEELDEVAVDLATVVNGAPASNQVVYFENQSTHDPRSQMYIPEVIPGLIGVRIGIRTTESANLVLEASMRVRQQKQRLAEDGDPVFDATPEIFRPVAPAEE